MILTPWSEVQDLLPPLSTEERETLQAKISNGIVEVPIFHLPDGRIIDGHHRWELSGGKYPYLQQVDLPEKEAFALAVSLNTARRQLSREQKQAIALALRQRGYTQAEAARVVGVGRKTVDDWEGGITNGGSAISYTPPDNRTVRPARRAGVRVVVHSALVVYNTDNDKWVKLKRPGQASYAPGLSEGVH